jgi:hypothetical protein
MIFIKILKIRVSPPTPEKNSGYAPVTKFKSLHFHMLLRGWEFTSHKNRRKVGKKTNWKACQKH